MFTDPSFSTPQGGDLKGVNSQPPDPLPSRPLLAAPLAAAPSPSPAPCSLRQLGFSPKPAQNHPNPRETKLNLRHAIPPRPQPPLTLLAPPARLPHVHPGGPSRATIPLPQPTGAATATTTAALAGKPPESAVSRAILTGTPANVARDTRHCQSHRTPRAAPGSPPTDLPSYLAPKPQAPPARASTPTTSSTRWKYGS